MLLERIGISILAYILLILLWAMVGFGIEHHDVLACMIPIEIVSILLITLMTWYSLNRDYDSFASTGSRLLDKTICYVSTATIYTAGCVGLLGVGFLIILPLILSTFVTCRELFY